MNRIIKLALVPLVIGLAGCATQGSLESTRSDIDAVKTRLFSLERDLGSVRSETKEQIGALETGLRADISATRKISADLQANIDSTKAEMQALSGKVDDTATTAKQPGEELTRYRNDADKRIILMEDRILKLQGSVDELNKKLAEVAQQKEVPASPDALYIKGLELFKAGDMPAARERLQKFIEQNPNHELVANAHYWIGETHYSEKAYEPAILSFQEVIKNFPDKEKAPAAMLKQAMSFKAINDLKSARYVLKKLVDGYPKSEEAKKAKDLQKEIK
ncbi:tol-pal system protein YbgF [Pelotalea chapellei]|uniref:Tol-pal system protein YbgF n=1 Tax=Pelotalea chapellei TaxID=44671 RepID=A0ABS5U6T5_9BACT|nr:tol-pal system protein YbgF [Pelotalea chapellei]MBT1071379.1 tol-pal system protein YbgF [Pelotalea chapellei]